MSCGKFRRRVGIGCNDWSNRLRPRFSSCHVRTLSAVHNLNSFSKINGPWPLSKKRTHSRSFEFAFSDLTSIKLRWLKHPDVRDHLHSELLFTGCVTPSN